MNRRRILLIAGLPLLLLLGAGGAVYLTTKSSQPPPLSSGSRTLTLGSPHSGAFGLSRSATIQLAYTHSGYMRGYQTVSWPPVAGAVGYGLVRDGVQVATAGAGATTTRFYVTAGLHTLSVVPLAATTTTTTSAVTTVAAPPAPSSGYFAANSPWNTPVPSGYPSSSNSSALVSRINGSGFGVGVNQGAWTPVVYFAPAGTPRYRATNPDGWIVDDVPIPSNYVTPLDSDAMVVIVDQAWGRIYNIPQLAKNSSGNWTFGPAGVFDPNGSGWWDGTIGPWSGRAANSSLLGGLITPEDVKAGVINHALALALPVSIQSGHVSPAPTGDGTCTSSPCVPEGSWFQLDPTLNDAALMSLGFTQGELILAHAMQRYGIFDVDSTNSSISFYAQNTTSPGGASYGYPSDWSNGINRAFLSHLRVLQPPAVPKYDDRNTYGEPHK